jgi:hypothetical protein
LGGVTAYPVGDYRLFPLSPAALSNGEGAIVRAQIKVGIAVTALLTGWFVASGPATAQPALDCDNYQPCVPVSEDVDCASGEGDGPAYIDYPVTVIGEDVYGLDHDGNGTGCENETGTGPQPPATPTTQPPATTPTTEPPAQEPAPAATPVVAEPDFTG